MQKIASPRELQAELQSLMAFVHGHGPDGKPNRQVIASKLRELADRTAAGGLYRNNMMYNRQMAMKLNKAGWTVEQIAEGWPKIWKASGGRLSSRVREDTRLTMIEVDKALRMGPEKFLAQ